MVISNSSIVSYYEYTYKGYVYDTIRNSINRIDAIYTNIEENDIFISLCIASDDLCGAYTHYLTLEEVRKLYPYIGKCLKTARLLYEK